MNQFIHFILWALGQFSFCLSKPMFYQTLEIVAKREAITLKGALVFMTCFLPLLIFGITCLYDYPIRTDWDEAVRVSIIFCVLFFPMVSLVGLSLGARAVIKAKRKKALLYSVMPAAWLFWVSLGYLFL